MQTSLKLTSVAKYLMLAGMAAGLVACGGGDDAPAAPPPPTFTTLTINGTAAVGAALANASVTAACRTGTGTATAGANGSFSVVVAGSGANAAGPCVLTAATSTTTLRSITPGAGAANITPLTDLLTNYLATRVGITNPSAVTSANLLGNTGFTTLTSNPTEIQNSANQVVSTLGGLGVTGLPTDFLTATIVPPSGGTAGNAQDQALERLRTAGLVTATGVASTSAATALTQAANNNRVTGATGAN